MGGRKLRALGRDNCEKFRFLNERKLRVVRRKLKAVRRKLKAVRKKLKAVRKNLKAVREKVFVVSAVEKEKRDWKK